jgi:predicted component of type VI protein secretion system
MAGMRAAVQGVLGRFDPQAIESAFESSQKGISLGSRKAKLWERFVVQQEKLSRDAQDDFNKAFGRDFIAAYQAQWKRIKDER